jgi:UDP-GlcNAc:undecaprenyl-phosphate GlcNAc-1-phosphate transferase
VPAALTTNPTDFVLSLGLFAGPAAVLRFAKVEMLLFFTGALLVGALGVWWVVKRESKVGMDAPDSRRKFHAKPISRLGGAPIFAVLALGTAVAAWFGFLSWERWMPLALCNTMIFSVGLMDDIKPLGARVKLIGQIGAALILYALGVSIDFLSNPFGEGSLDLGWWALPLTVFWLVAIPNIVNLIDGMDGLAGGFGMFLCLTVAFVGHYQLQPDVVVVSLVMAGALGGFLIFNFPPAKIFLGDGGAYLIGFFIASVSLLSSNKGSVIGALLVMIIALGVPILDTLFAILRRSIRGVPVFRADAEHIHHRLILLGYSKGRALVAMYSVCLALSLVGISILMLKGIALPVAGAVLFLLSLGAARYLGYIRSFKMVRRQVGEALERRRVREYFRVQGRVLDFEVERSGSLDEFETELVHAMTRMGVRFGMADGFEAVDLKLECGVALRVYHPIDVESREEWQIRLDQMQPALERCHDRWGRLPGVVELISAVKTVESLPQDGTIPVT